MTNQAINGATLMVVVFSLFFIKKTGVCYGIWRYGKWVISLNFKLQMCNFDEKNGTHKKKSKSATGWAFNLRVTIWNGTKMKQQSPDVNKFHFNYYNFFGSRFQWIFLFCVAKRATHSCQPNESFHSDIASTEFLHFCRMNWMRTAILQLSYSILYIARKLAMSSTSSHNL